MYNRSTTWDGKEMMIRTHRSENDRYAVDMTNTVSGYVLFVTDKATRYTATVLVKEGHLDLIKDVIDKERKQCEYTSNR